RPAVRGMSSASPLYLNEPTSIAATFAAGQCQLRTHAPQQTVGLFDQFVCAAGQRQWDSDAKRLGSIEVDDQLDFHHLLNRQAGRCGTFDNSPAVGPNLPIAFSNVGSIAYQAARSSELAVRINRGNRIPRRERDKSSGPVREQGVGTYDKGHRVFFC